jgi:hypothetical protein
VEGSVCCHSRHTSIEKTAIADALLKLFSCRTAHIVSSFLLLYSKMTTEKSIMPDEKAGVFTYRPNLYHSKELEAICIKMM